MKKLIISLLLASSLAQAEMTQGEFYKEVTKEGVKTATTTDDMGYGDLRSMTPEEVSKEFNISTAAAEEVLKLWRWLPEDLEPGDYFETDNGVYTLLDQDDYNQQIWEYEGPNKTTRWKCVGQKGHDLSSNKVLPFDPICTYYNVNE